MDKGVNPEVAWKLVLNEAGQIRWLETDRQGQHKEYSHEPMTSIWQRFFAGVIRILPIESQL